MDYSKVNDEIRAQIQTINKLKSENLCESKRLEDKLIISLNYLVYSVMRRYRKHGNYEDLYQEGMIGLIKAVQNYNANTSFHFTRYALWWIKARINRTVRKMSVVSRSLTDNKYLIQYDFHENDMIDYNNPEQNVISSEQERIISTEIEKLTDNQKYIINYHYGLKDQEQISMREIGSDLKMTRADLRRTERIILNKLKTAVR